MNTQSRRGLTPPPPGFPLLAAVAWSQVWRATRCHRLSQSIPNPTPAGTFPPVLCEGPLPRPAAERLHLSSPKSTLQHLSPQWVSPGLRASRRCWEPVPLSCTSLRSWETQRTEFTWTLSSSVNHTTLSSLLLHIKVSSKEGGPVRRLLAPMGSLWHVRDSLLLLCGSLRLSQDSQFFSGTSFSRVCTWFLLRYNWHLTATHTLSRLSPLSTATLSALPWEVLLHPCALWFVWVTILQLYQILRFWGSRSIYKAHLWPQKALASKAMSLLLIFINIQKLNCLLYSGVCLPFPRGNDDSDSSVESPGTTGNCTCLEEKTSKYGSHIQSPIL